MNEFSVTGDAELDEIVANLADEYMERVASGETPDIHAMAGRFPKHERVIRQVLASLVHVAPATSVANSSCDTQPNDALTSSLAGRIGDFEIVREIGRGGMGIVYEAMQISLGRRVALKILPFAAGLDPQKRKRFQIEAQAAATLQHAHIVPIFGSGYDRDVHYMAMQLIEGYALDQRLSPRSLTDEPSLENPRSPSAWSKSQGQRHAVRQIARWGLQIARAIDHAHSAGIVHRDIKPSNILIDRNDHVWVTDFGLAHIEANATLTMSGDLVGTLRYMSPEQGAGQHAIVDHRTDIYSLGATLYELLAGQPAFTGDDRVQLMRQILDANPAPLRRLQKHIPLALERIVAKAMASDPAERYATAGALADDLQRFLDDLPILAKKPSFAQRLAHWSRRHRTFVRAAMVLFALTMIGLVISNVAISRQKTRAESALHDATINERRAITEATKAKKINEVLLRLLESAHPDQMRGSEYTVREMLDQVSDTLLAELRDQPEVAATLQSTVGNAYRRLGHTEKAAPLLASAARLRAEHLATDKLQRAEALEDLAWNDAARRDYPEAVRHAREALAIHEAMSRVSDAMVHNLWCLQHCLIYLGKYAEADAISVRALAMARQLTPPSLVQANILHDAAQSKTLQNQPAVAEPLAREAVALHRASHGNSHPETAWGLEALGRALHAQHKLAEAEAVFREALSIFEQQYDADHKSVRQTQELLTQVLVEQGNQAGAQQLADERAAKLSRRLWQPSVRSAEALATVMEHRAPFVAAQVVLDLSDQFEKPDDCLRAAAMLGSCARLLTSTEDAEQRQSKAQEYDNQRKLLLERAAARCPDDAAALNNLAWEFAQHANPLLREPRLAISLSERSVAKAPAMQIYWNTLGVAQYRAGEISTAVSTLEHAMSLPGNDEFDRFFLAMALWRQGQPERARQLYQEALEFLGRRTQVTEELRSIQREADLVID